MILQKEGSIPEDLKLGKYVVPLALLAMVLLGLALRLPGTGMGYWRDEMHVYYASHLPGIGDLLQKLPVFEYGPPLFYVIMWIWVFLTGGNEALFTVPLLLCGLLLIPSTYFLARRAHSQIAGLIAAFLVTIAPSAVYWSQEVRPYQFAALLSSLTASTYLLALEKKKPKYLLAFLLCGIVQSYLHYTCLMMLALLFFITLVIALSSKSKQSLPLLCCFPVMGLAFLPWAPNLFSHMGTGVLDYVKPELSEWPLIFFSNLTHSLPLSQEITSQIILRAADCSILLLLVPPLAALLFMRLLKVRNPESGLSPLPILAACFLAEASVVQYLTPYATSRYLYPVMPLFWCLIASLIASALMRLRAGGKSLKTVCPSLLLVSSALVVTGVDVYSDCHETVGRRSGIEPLVNEAAKIKPEDQAHMAFLVVPDFNSVTFAYYAKRAGLKAWIHGMPRWDDLSPSMPKVTAREWPRAELVSEIEARIAELPAREHVNKLCLVCDEYMPNTPAFPAKKAVKKLVEDLSAKYKFIGARKFPGLRDSQDLLMFEIH